MVTAARRARSTLQRVDTVTALAFPASPVPSLRARQAASQARSMANRSHGIEPRADKVIFRYKCRQTKDVIHEVDLNDMVRRDPPFGALAAAKPVVAD